MFRRLIMGLLQNALIVSLRGAKRRSNPLFFNGLKIASLSLAMTKRLFCNSPIIKVSGLMIIMFIINIGNAFALDYNGGSYDGYTMESGANVDVATISSAADQTFTTSDSTTAISAVTITMDIKQAGGGITTANGIRVKIPASLDMVWDTTDTTATITGTASGKVSSTVSYEDLGKTLVINVTADFINGDSITVSNLSFKNFNSVTQSHLELEIDNLGTTIATDDKRKSIGIPASSVTFTGGSYDGFGTETNISSFDSLQLGGD